MHEQLVSSIKKNSYNVSAWLEKGFNRVPIPLITSVTLKDGGYKIAPVDITIFPEGFDNICKADLKNAPKLVKKYLKDHFSDIPNLKKVLILAPTQHWNPHFYSHLYSLIQLLKKSKLQVKVGSLKPISKKVKVKTADKKTLEILPTHIKDRRIYCESFEAELIYVSYAVEPEISGQLSQLYQAITPLPKVLKRTHKKSDYLASVNRLATDFARITEIDPWLIRSEFQVEKHVNFDERSGIEKVAHSTDTLIGMIEMKYKEYGIPSDPSVLIHNNTGTYGMGMMTVHSAKELAGFYQLKKKKKVGTKVQKMVINDVIVREDIPTTTFFKRYQGEMVIYLIGSEVAGGYIRTFVSPKADRKELFVPLCMTGRAHTHRKKLSDKKLNFLYSNISKVSCLAAGFSVDKIPS